MITELIPFFEYTDSLSEDEKGLLYKYTSDYHSSLNDDEISRIFDIFKRGPFVKTSITLYRGLSSRYDDRLSGGVLSTSYVKDVVKNFTYGNCCSYIITLTPGNYTILPVETMSESPDEHEVLLPPGKLSLQMTEVVEGNEWFYCTYIPGNAIVIDTDKI